MEMVREVITCRHLSLFNSNAPNSFLGFFISKISLSLAEELHRVLTQSLRTTYSKIKKIKHRKCN